MCYQHAPEQLDVSWDTPGTSCHFLGGIVPEKQITTFKSLYNNYSSHHFKYLNKKLWKVQYHHTTNQHTWHYNQHYRKSLTFITGDGNLYLISHSPDSTSQMQTLLSVETLSNLYPALDQLTINKEILSHSPCNDISSWKQWLSVAFFCYYYSSVSLFTYYRFQVLWSAKDLLL